MKQIVPLPMPRTELGEGQVTAESPKTPAAPSPVTTGQRAPAGDLSEKSRPRLVVPSFEKGGKELMIAASRPLLRKSVHRPCPPTMATREREVAPVGAEVLGTAQDRAGRQEAGNVFETLLPEQKWKEKMADTVVAAGESKKNDVRVRSLITNGITCDSPVQLSLNAGLSTRSNPP